MDEYLDAEAETFIGEDSSKDGDDADRFGHVHEATSGEDEHTQSPSPHYRQTSRGELACKRKKIVQWTLLTMIILEDEVVQFATDLLASTLQMTLAQEDISVHSPSAAGASNVPALNSLEHTAELPPTNGAPLDTTIAPPTSLTTVLVSIGKIQHISLSPFFIYYMLMGFNSLSPFRG